MLYYNIGFNDFKQAVNNECIRDVSDEISYVGNIIKINNSDFLLWCQSVEANINKDTRALRLAFGLMQQRYINKTIWEPNDMIDLAMLSTASGYADYVLCEKKTANLINSVYKKDNYLYAQVFYNVKELVNALEL